MSQIRSNLLLSLQALLDLLEPYFSPLIDDLLDDVESGRTWTQGQVPEAVAKLTANIMDIAHLIPPSFYQVGNQGCHLMIIKAGTVKELVSMTSSFALPKLRRVLSYQVNQSK